MDLTKWAVVSFDYRQKKGGPNMDRRIFDLLEFFMSIKEDS